MYYFDKLFMYKSQQWYVLVLDEPEYRRPLYKWADNELISPENEKNYWKNIIKGDIKRNIKMYAIPEKEIKKAKTTLKFGEPNCIINNEAKAKKIRFLDSQLDEDDKIKNIKLEYTIDTTEYIDKDAQFADDPSYEWD